MKKMIIFIFIMFSILFLANAPYVNLNDLQVDGLYICYDAINLDNSLKSEMKYSKYIFGEVEKVAGECLEMKNSDNINHIIKFLLADMIYSEKIDDIVINYYYSPRLKNFVNVNNQRVNLMISISNIVKVGYPIIFDSF